MLSCDEAKAALRDVLASIGYALENDLQVLQALNQAGNDQLRRMQLVYPLLCQLQMNAVRKYGFSNDGDGMVKFAQEICALEKQDEELQKLNENLRHICFPPLPDNGNYGDAHRLRNGPTENES